MAEAPDTLYGEGGSSYQFQDETLSKHFVRRAARRIVAPATGVPSRRPPDELF